jgi:hypothetical protein
MCEAFIAEVPRYRERNPTPAVAARLEAERRIADIEIGHRTADRYAIDPTVAAISAMLITIPVIALPFVRRRGGPIP